MAVPEVQHLCKQPGDRRRLGGDAAPRETDDADPGDREVGVAAAVALERLAVGVERVAVQLDDQAFRRPVQVDQVSCDVHVCAWRRQPGAGDQVEQPSLGLRPRGRRTRPALPRNPTQRR